MKQRNSLIISLEIRVYNIIIKLINYIFFLLYYNIIIMGGGIMQLVAYGAQDIYLTGNPQITFFKIVYRRHTNFSMETIKQNISGQSFIGVDNINNKATVTISRNGDLVTGIYVSAKQKDSTGTVGICGDNLVEDVEIEIGGQRIDKHYKEWNQIWDELTISASKSEGYK